MNFIPRALRHHPILAVIGICVLVTFVFVYRNLSRPENDARLASIRQGDYPVTLADLNTYYPYVADELNSARVYEEAFKLDLFTNSVFEDIGREFPSVRGERVAAELREELEAAFATNATAVNLLFGATNLSSSRYPLDMQNGHMLMLPHLAKIKRGTTLLSLKAVSDASAGKADLAYDDLFAALHVGTSLEREPILISYLVRVACSSIVAKRTEQVLNLVAFKDEQLKSLQEKFALEENPEAATRALAGERAFGLSFFINRNMQRYLFSPQQGIGGMPSGWEGQLMFFAYRASGLMRKDRDFYLDAMATHLERARTAPESRENSPPGSVPNLQLQMTNRLLILSRMILPALQKTLDRSDEHSARIRVVQTALALERYRVAHKGDLPANLQKLTPDYLRQVPVDPYDSLPLKFKKLGQGYVVYSVGPDKQDDGGAEQPSPTKGKSGSKARATPQDLTFIVER